MSHTTQDYSIERYAERIIAGGPSQYDSIELQGVRQEQTGPDSFEYTVDNENPQAYSVYLHLIDGGVDCVGDFTRLTDAREYAVELRATYGFAIFDYAQPAPIPA